MWGPHLFVLLRSLEMPKDELPNHNCIKHLRSVVQQQQTRIAELEKTSAEHKHQLAEQVGWQMPRGGDAGLSCCSAAACHSPLPCPSSPRNVTSSC